MPLPAAHGTVVNAEGRALAQAVISLEDGSECGREQKLPPIRTETDIDLGRITLTKGHPLIVKIKRPDAAKPARVALILAVPDRYRHSQIATREITGREQEVTFDSVGEGKYLVLIEGSEPLEKLEVPIEVEKDEAETRDTITIDPYRLDGTVRFGDELLADGSIEIIARGHTWRESVPIVNGKFGGTMWQRGTVSAFVRAGKQMGEFLTSPSLGDDPSHWDVKIEKRLISGRVFDAETNKPVSEVGMQCVAETENSRSYGGVTVKEDGSYQILANRPGTYTLRIQSQDYLAVETEVKIAAEDKSRTLDFPLERGVMQPLEIVTPAGEAIRDAMILEGVQPDRVNPRQMFPVDPSGRFTLRGKAGETRLLYVIPRGGSFAIVRVVIPQNSAQAKPLQVIVAPPLSTLRVQTLDKDKKPVRAGLLIRYNGEFLPNAIARFLADEYIGTNASGEAVLSRFPAGTYELWALTSRGDEEAIIASGGTLRAPARVGLSGGVQAVTLAAPEKELPPRP